MTEVLKYTDLTLWALLIIGLVMLFCKLNGSAPEIPKRLVAVSLVALAMFALWRINIPEGRLLYAVQLTTLAALVGTLVTAMACKRNGLPSYVTHVHASLPFLFASLMLELLHHARPAEHSQLQALQLLTTCIGMACGFYGCVRWPVTKKYQQH